MVLIFTFLYLPIAILIIYSFNKSRLNVIWTGFTFDWYKRLMQDQDVLNALMNSLKVAFISTTLSTMIGIMTSVGMYKYKFRGKSVLDALLYIPIVIPEVVMGISLLVFFNMVHVPSGLLTLILAHITFSVPFIVMVVNARLAGFDKSLEEASMDLGATQWETFWKVTLPLIMPGVVAGALLAFTLSIDDVTVSFFVAGPTSTTLPLKIFSMVKFGVSPEINALSTIMIFITLSLALIGEKIRFSKQNN